MLRKSNKYVIPQISIYLVGHIGNTRLTKTLHLLQEISQRVSTTRMDLRPYIRLRHSLVLTFKELKVRSYPRNSTRQLGISKLISLWTEKLMRQLSFMLRLQVMVIGTNLLRLSITIRKATSCRRTLLLSIPNLLTNCLSSWLIKYMMGSASQLL